MQRTALLVCVIAAIVGALASEPRAQSPAPLAGVWALNRAASELPREMGFTVTGLPPAPAAEGGQSAGSGGGGRGRRGGGGDRSGGSLSAPLVSYLDGQRVRLMTTEARNPPARLIVVDTPATVTMTTELGESRTVHPNGREESIEIQATPINVTAHRDGDKLVVVYHVERSRDVQYTFARPDARQLVVDVEFLEKGVAGDKARRVYEPGLETETRSEAPRSTPSSPGAPAAGQPHETFDERPGAELRGLKTLGILIEDLSSQAIACGVSHDGLEAALSKRLGDGGFTVRRNSDDDTYLYVNVMTTSSNGACTSRYDAFLYTHATANLSYRDRPALVQVSLMHRGGLASSGANTHAAAIQRGLEGYVDTFIGLIRQANQ